MKPTINGKELIFCGLMLVACSLCGAKTDTPEAEVRRLEMDIPSLYLVNGMFLSAEQAKQLAELLSESAKIHAQNQKELRQFVINNQNEIDSLLDQMITGKKETTQQIPVKRGRKEYQLHHVRNDWQNLINRSQYDLDGIARKTRDMLTPAQRDILDRFVPCFVPPGDFRNPERVGQAAADASPANTAMLARLRSSPPEQLNNAIERALDGLVPGIMKDQRSQLTKPQIDELRDELRPSLKELTARIRNMNDSDFELEKTKLAKEMAGLYSTSGAKSGGGGFGDLGKIKRYILNPGIAPIIAQRAGSPGAVYKESVTPSTTVDEIKQKNAAFQAARLMNDLLLTAGQAKSLQSVIQKAVAARAEITLEAADIFPQALTAYAALKKELAGQQISPATEKEAQKFNHQLKMLYQEKLAKTILDCQSEMDRLLTADQVTFLTGRQDGRQANRQQSEQLKRNIFIVRSRAREAFDKMDQMKDAEFNSGSSGLCAQFVDSCLEINVIDRDDIDKEAEIARANQVLLRARHMKGAQYNKAREDLVAEICPRRNKPRPELFGWQKSMGDQLEVVDQNTQILLGPAGQAMIEKKIKVGN